MTFVGTFSNRDGNFLKVHILPPQSENLIRVAILKNTASNSIVR